MRLHKLYIVEWVDSVQPVASWHALDGLPALVVFQLGECKQGYRMGKVSKASFRKNKNGKMPNSFASFGKHLDVFVMPFSILKIVF